MTPPDRAPEPLGARALDHWRREVQHRTVDPSLPWPDSEVVVLVGRLLATLDAARSPRPSLACPCECNASPPQFCGGCGHAGCSGGINLRRL